MVYLLITVYGNTLLLPFAYYRRFSLMVPFFSPSSVLQVLSRDYSIGAVNEDDLNAEFANLDSELEGLGDLDDIGQANMNPGMANSNSIPVAQPYDPDLAALMGNNGTNNGNNTASWMLPSPPTGSTTTVPQNRVPTSVMGSSSSTSGYGGR